jgi:hypothetical protein
MKGPKWLEEIELANSERNGFWENQGWDRMALVKTMSRIDVPRDGFIVKVGPVEMSGVAFAGSRGIAEVEVSTDDGHNWAAATLRPPLSQWSWVLWRYTWQPAAEGSYTLKVRARSGDGELQAANQAQSFPNGSSGYHTIRVSVSR